MITDKLLLEWTRQAYPLMKTKYDYEELDCYDMEKFSIWVVKLLNVPPLSTRREFLIAAKKTECTQEYWEVNHVEELKQIDWILETLKI